MKKTFLQMNSILFKRVSIRKKIYLVIFSFLFLFVQVIGYNCSKYDSARLNNPTTYIFILGIPVMYFLFKILFEFSYKKRLDTQKSVRFKKVFLISFILIFIAWLPIIVSFYPNNYSVDASTQVRMVIYNDISKYHPVIHTIFFGGVLKLSNMFFHNYTIGNFIYGLIQSFIMDAIFSYFILFLYKEKSPRWLIIVSILSFMFLPTNSVLAITTTKDVIFSGLVLLIVIQFYKIVSKENYLDNKKNILYITITILLSLMFRNNMLYAIILFFIPCIILLKKYRKKIIILFLLPVVLYSIYDISLTKLFSIPNGPRIEAFSVVVQQFARVYNKDNLTESEKSMIKKLYNNNSLDQYNSQVSDPVKSEFNSNELFSNFKKYVKLYIKLGRKHPLTYIDSFLDNNYGYFYFFDRLPKEGIKTYIWVTCMDKDKGFSCTDNCNKNFIYTLYDKLLEKANYQKIPIINIILNIGFNIFLLLFTIALLIYKRKLKLTIPLLILVSLLITNLLGPIAIMRYVYPIFVCFPFMIFLIRKVYLEEN